MGVRGGGGEDGCENARDTGVAGEFIGGKGSMAVVGGGTLYIWWYSFRGELFIMLKWR